MTTPRLTPAACVAGALLLGCAANPETVVPPAERGQELFEVGPLTTSSLNFYTCATCHEKQPSGSPRRTPGAALAGVVDRPSYWGGQEDDLLRSINACRSYFMYASEPLAADEPDAIALYGFLSELEPGDSNPVPFSVVRTIDDLPRGNAESGRQIYEKACSSCHGRMHDAAGTLSRRIPLLPEGTLLDHEDLTPRVQRLVFIEKTRHGGFFGYGGAMPPLSTEVLSDAELSDVLEALGVFGT